MRQPQSLINEWAGWRQIFPETITTNGVVNLLAAPKYGSTGIDKTLHEAFGTDNKLSDGVLAGTSLVIPAFDLASDRPLLFYYNSPDPKDPKDEEDWGYGALHRSLSEEEHTILEEEEAHHASLQSPEGEKGKKHSSELVRIGRHDFKVWEVVRASTAAPTYFPIAAVHNIDSRGQNRVVPCADGGLVANNPSMVAVSFACSKWEHLPLSEVAVLSIGTGASTQLADVKWNGSMLGWIGGPLMDIVTGSSPELTAAMLDQIAEEAQNDEDQFLRVQITAGVDAKGNDMLTLFNRQIKHDSDAFKPFARALRVNHPRGVSAGTVLASLDGAEYKDELLALGYELAHSKEVWDRLTHFVKHYVFRNPKHYAVHSRVPLGPLKKQLAVLSPKDRASLRAYLTALDAEQ
ncbi:hypothetical protein WJX72_000546 [[Myrmecia] bisecta]|uniref:Patatin n=1 Tax=[Myrmecia] bisecta TaxID=41462 RepID=A0AAW1QE47_9CHLO